MKTLNAPGKTGELLRAGYALTVTGSALVEWIASGGVKKGPIAIVGSQTIGPFPTDIQLIITALSAVISYDVVADADDLVQGSGILPLIYKSGVASSSTGTTSLVTLGSVTIPGGLLLPNSQVEISALFSTLGTVGNKTYGITFGGQGIYNQSYAGAQATGIDRRVACRNSLSSQVVVAGWVESQSGSHTAGASYLTVDTTSDVIINFNGTLTTSSETIKLESYLVKIDL